MTLTATEQEQLQDQLREIKSALEMLSRKNEEILRRLDSRQFPDPPANKHEEPNVADMARIPIGKAAELLGISRDTLREHTDNGYIKCNFNRVNKRRFYQGKEIKRYWRSYL